MLAQTRAKDGKPTFKLIARKMPVTVYVLGPHENDGSDGGLKRNVTRFVMEFPATATVYRISEKLGRSLAFYGPKGKRLSNEASLRSERPRPSCFLTCAFAAICAFHQPHEDCSSIHTQMTFAWGQ